jgi:hypothetical protein
MTRLAFILALLFTAPWEAAEIVDVRDRGAVDLKPFDVISRVCYDSESRRMLVQRHAVYHQYCDLPKHTRDAFLNAPSMGRYYRTNIEGADGSAPYACPDA